MSASVGCTLAFPKQRQVKLTGADYRAFQQAVFEADCWTCRCCGQVKPLTVHHVVRRSRQRLDELTNALSLCVSCHQLETDRRITIEWVDPIARTVRIVSAGNSHKSAPSRHDLPFLRGEGATGATESVKTKNSEFSKECYGARNKSGVPGPDCPLYATGNRAGTHSTYGAV